MLAAGWRGMEAVKAWSVNTSREERSFAGAAGPVRAAAVSRNGQLVATAADDKQVRVYQFADGRLFQQIAGCMGLESRVDIAAVGNLSQEDQPGGGQRGLDLAPDFDAVQQGHANIEHNHIGLQEPRLIHQFAAIRRKSGDIEFGFQDPPKAFQDYGVIVGQQ